MEREMAIEMSRVSRAKLLKKFQKEVKEKVMSNVDNDIEDILSFIVCPHCNKFVYGD